MPRPILFRRRGLAFPGGLRPGFDPNHPASAGISPGHGLSAVAQGNTFINILNATKATITTGTPAAVIDGLIGPTCYVGAGGATDHVTFSGNAAATDNNVTFAAIWRQVGTPANDAFYLTSSNVGNTGWGMNFSHASGSNDLTITDFATGAWDDCGFVITPGHAYFGAISASTSGSGYATWFLIDLNTGIAGVLTYPFADTAAGWAASGASDGVYSIGFNNFAPLAKIAAVMWAPTCLSYWQIWQWAQDPWSFWYPTPINAVAFDPAWTVAAVSGATLGAPMQVLMM